MQRNGVPDTSPSLLIRIRNPEDKESWKTFERIYGAVVRDYCGYWNLQPADAEDITQEVLAAVANSIHKFDYDPQKGRFRGWLGTITSNKIKRWLTNKTNRRESQISMHSEAAEASDLVSDPDDNWINSFCGVILKEACQLARVEFEDTTWKCFEETWIKHNSPQQTATALGVAVHSVYVNKSRILKRLEAIIQDLAEDMAFDAPNP